MDGVNYSRLLTFYQTTFTVVLVGLPSYQLNGINLLESNYRWIFHCAFVVCLLRSPGEDMAVNISYLVYSRYYLEYTT